MKANVTLHGVLGEKFGRTHVFHVDTPAEIFRALHANHPTFLKTIKELEDSYLGYELTMDGKPLHPEAQSSVIFDVPETNIEMVPVVIGSGLDPVSLFIVQFIVSMVLNFVISSIFRMLSDPPENKQQPTSNESYYFDGPVNVSKQGGPVPLAYGEVIAGSVVMSSGIDITDTPL